MTQFFVHDLLLHGGFMLTVSNIPMIFKKTIWKEITSTWWVFCHEFETYLHQLEFIIFPIFSG